jgi:riboflavin kinase/FMN adenylyltransferase
VASDGVVFSSTYVRSCVDAGDVETAARVLGRPHRLEGVVVRGDQRGREIGFPTANLMTARHTAIPADGVYAAWLIRGGQRLPAAVSIGTNPTFAATERRIEAYVLDFAGDLYGERLALDFVARLRQMEKFSNVEALVDAIDDDVARTRAILGVGESA